MFVYVVQPRKNNHSARIADPGLPVVDVSEGSDAVNPKRIDPFCKFAPLLRTSNDRQPVAQPARKSEAADDPNELAGVTTIAERNEEAVHTGKTMRCGSTAARHSTLLRKSAVAAMVR